MTIDIFEFRIPINIHLDAKIIILCLLEAKIWPFIFLAAMLGAILDISISPRVPRTHPSDPY